MARYTIPGYAGQTRDTARAHAMRGCNAGYRLVVGEVGNEQGHVVSTSALTLAGARRALAARLAEYGGDGWGYVEVDEYNDSRWQRLD